MFGQLPTYTVTLARERKKRTDPDRQLTTSYPEVKKKRGMGWPVRLDPAESNVPTGSVIAYEAKRLGGRVTEWPVCSALESVQCG